MIWEHPDRVNHDQMTEDQREAFEERAAIREHDGGQSRREAERGALEDLRREVAELRAEVRQGCADIVSMSEAARRLPMRDGDAFKWLKRQRLVSKLDGRDVVIWADVAERLRTLSAPKPKPRAKQARLALPRVPLGR